PRLLSRHLAITSGLHTPHHHRELRAREDGQPSRVALVPPSIQVEEEPRKPSPTRDCTAESRLRKSLRRSAWLTSQGQMEKARQGRGKAAPRARIRGQIHPPSQETGEVRSPRDVSRRQANLQIPTRAGVE